MYEGTKIGLIIFIGKDMGKIEKFSRMENGDLEISFGFQIKAAFNHWLNKNKY